MVKDGVDGTDATIGGGSSSEPHFFRRFQNFLRFFGGKRAVNIHLCLYVISKHL
jgi:hypothetical protein